jgi:hypothetical protein
VIEVAALAALEHGLDRLEDPAVEGHAVPAGAERDPVQVDGCGG